MPNQKSQIAPVADAPQDQASTKVAGPRQIVPPMNFVGRGVTAVVGSQGAPPAILVNHGGPVLGSVQVTPVFWGAAWTTGTNAQLVPQLEAFFDTILSSSMMDMLNEYSTASTQIQHGTRQPTVNINTEPGTVTPTGRQVTDAQVQTALQGWIQNGTVPATTANTLYFIYLPPNVVSILGTIGSCIQF